MKRTARQASTRTLADLIRAMDGQRAVTITYAKADGEASVRTIEIYDICTTSAGRILICAMDRLRGERRTFHPEQIESYTVHRIRCEMTAPSGEMSSHAAKTVGRFIALELNRDYLRAGRVALAA
ncbi:WYL domain-containing protein [Streptomyces sp. H39-C1]|uniref:WYL domain-containing protein n=1 Tax=Streptomyces sp. H39-C1 TaxID=3004355 RepID=UPI0022AF33C2|nr:WYL domain-containing protein [Streptomyces sp. H39-C1]MCZ4098089.1 WYL domain-containing protein [Streptomyces sp. H39-C1]